MTNEEEEGDDIRTYYVHTTNSPGIVALLVGQGERGERADASTAGPDERGGAPVGEATDIVGMRRRS